MLTIWLKGSAYQRMIYFMCTCTAGNEDSCNIYLTALSRVKCLWQSWTFHDNIISLCVIGNGVKYNAIIHMWTVVVDESEEWSSQWIFQFKQLERRNLKNWIRASTGFNSLKPWFFQTFLSNCLNWKINCDDHSSLSSTTAVQILIISYTLDIINFFYRPSIQLQSKAKNLFSSLIPSGSIQDKAINIL